MPIINFGPYELETDGGTFVVESIDTDSTKRLIGRRKCAVFGDRPIRWDLFGTTRDESRDYNLLGSDAKTLAVIAAARQRLAERDVSKARRWGRRR